MSAGEGSQERNVLLRGHDHPAIGTFAVAAVDTSLAVGITAGARAKPRPARDPNEDVGAVARGSRADLLVVADGHFGREAAELVVDHVLDVLGSDPPPADLSDEDLVALFYAAGLAVVRDTTRPGCPYPDSRSTLAMALVTDDAVQWAAIGDSCVVVTASDGGARLDTPRSAYLGHRFTTADVAGAMSRGRSERVASTCIVLATDGLVDGLEKDRPGVVEAVREEAQNASTATYVAEALLRRTLRLDVADAVTVAVAFA